MDKQPHVMVGALEKEQGSRDIRKTIFTIWPATKRQRQKMQMRSLLLLTQDLPKVGRHSAQKNEFWERKI